jgi:hypothetical protein
MALFSNPALILVTSLLALPVVGKSLATIDPADITSDYTAVYKVLRNDKELAAVTISLSHQDDTWKLHGFSHDTRGLAKFLNIKGTQTTTGKWQNGRFRPDNYEFSFSLIGFKSSWQAMFDWQAGIVETHSRQGESRLPMSGVADDPFSLSLNLRSQLSEHLSDESANMMVDAQVVDAQVVDARVVDARVVDAWVVDEGKIENQLYHYERQVEIDTGLGCLDTALVRRVRENEKRLSLGWYARDHEYIPVRMQHKNKKGASLELVIVSLEIHGAAIQPTAPCS